MTTARITPVLLTAACLAAASAFGHGASKGLHLHVDPPRASRGETVTVKIDARRPLAAIRLGIAGTESTVEIEPDPCTRHVEARATIPEDAEGTISVHAEGTTTDGETVRAAAVVKIVRGPTVPEQAEGDE
jgi:hypothetical protein